MDVADKKFYFGLSAPSSQEYVLGLLQPWLEKTSGELRQALVDVQGVLKSAMQSDDISASKFHHVLVVIALAIATRPMGDEALVVSDAEGKPVVFDKPEEYRKYLLDVGVVSEDRYQEAWDLFVDFGVMVPKLDLEALLEAPATDAVDFCF